MAPDFG